MKNKPRIIQFSTGFQLGDAISQEMLELKSKLESAGYESQIYSENINKPDRAYVKKISKAKITKEDIILYHHSIHSDVLSHLLKFNNKRILVYHNVTPHHFFENYDLKFTYLLQEGRKDLKKIKENFDAFFGVSKFNQQELVENGMTDAGYLPLNLNFSKWANTDRISQPKDYIQFLFVGRIAPNKRQDDLIRFIKIWKLKSNIPVKLKLIGFCNPNQQTYIDELEFMIKTYDLKENIQIISYVNESILSKYYNESDYFISMSEHEGFCVPLMEAMHFQLLVLAFEAGAVSETLGGAGVLFSEKNFEKLADQVMDLENNISKRKTLILEQNKRIQIYMMKSSIDPLLNYLENN